MPANLTLIDAGTGNLRSVYKALENLGAEVELPPQKSCSRASALLAIL